MKICEIRILRGPNFWSIRKQKLIQMLLDLEDLEFKPTNEIPGFLERIKALIPSLHSHHCSEGHPGGFFERIKDGTWMGHVIEHIALEIQDLAGIKGPAFGRTRGTGKEGQYHVVFEYGEEEQGIATAYAAVRIAEALIKGESYNLQNDIVELRKLWDNHKPGPSTGSIVDEAKRRGIPIVRLEDESTIQLGYGAKQKQIQATISSNTNFIAVDLVGNKDATKKKLTEAFVPTPRGTMVERVENLRAAVDEVGFPLVVKPLDANQGKGATININSWQEALLAYDEAKLYSDKVIVERFIKGKDFRVLVINYKFEAAAMRKPAFVVGDGEHTIKELIDTVNSDPCRGEDHERVLTKIKVDADTRNILTKKGYTLNTVIAAGEELCLKSTANLSTGGTATDVTDTVHPSNIKLFERIARTVGLDICGIDIMSPDLSVPMKENGGAVIEVNAAPGFRMHLEPTYGKPRNVAAPVIDMLFPNDNGRIPLVAVTGTNGKTTTTRLIAAMAKHAGYVTGFTNTDGIYIDDELIFKGDCSGPSSAATVLKDLTVEFAVLETARGGMLRSGLAFDQCDCAVVTNVAEDHLGLDGIDTIEKLAKVKSIVPETVKQDGYAILNADDDLVYAMRERLNCKIALFSIYPNNVRIEEHCQNGGLAAIYDEGYIMLRRGNHIFPIEDVTRIPITFEGKAEFNIYNVLAASLAAYTNKISLTVISQVLRQFNPSVETTPGRANVYDFPAFKVMMDYAHNTHGLRALGKLIKAMPATHRIGIVTGVGDRRDEDIASLGEEAAKIFDLIIIRIDEDTRGRDAQQIHRLLKSGIKKAAPELPSLLIPEEQKALEHAIATAQEGTLIVVLTDNIPKAHNTIKRFQEQVKGIERTLIKHAV
jgi:cyanophycin synthetase